MTLSMLTTTVPGAMRLVKPPVAMAGLAAPSAAPSERTCFCVDCGKECSPYAIRAFYGRELCHTCYRAEEATCFAAQAEQWEELDFGRGDQMASLKSVLQGMGF